MTKVDQYIKIIRRAKELFAVEDINDPAWCAFLEKAWTKYMEPEQ